jgi:hypothetical protein
MDVAAVMLVVAFLLAVAGMVCLVLMAAVRWSRQSASIEPAQRLAQERAEALLRDMLTVAEYTQLGERGYLEVRSPTQPMRTYRVPRRPGRVAVHEFGVEIESLCVAPVGWLPPGDVVLAHKLMIEGNEQEYLRRANHFHRKVPTAAPFGRR